MRRPYLADLYRLGGETERARRAYRTVLQLLTESTPDPTTHTIPFDLPVNDVRFLCEHHLAKLSATEQKINHGH